MKKIIKWILIGIAAFMVLVLIFGGKSNAPEIEESTTIEQEVVKRFTVLSGIEKNPESSEYGVVVAPIINMWDSPEVLRVVGKVPHGSEVEILDENLNENGWGYYQIRFGSIGWVSDCFVTEIYRKDQEKEKEIQPTLEPTLTLKPTSIPTPTPTWYKGEYKITTIDKQEGKEDYDTGTINVWPSYEDRSRVLFKLTNNETIELIDYDSEHDYCKVQKSEKSGWIACGWIKNMPKSPNSYPS